MDRIRSYLLAQTVETLTRLLLEQAERDDGLLYRLQRVVAVAAGDVDSVRDSLRSRLTEATEVVGFIHRGEAAAWAEDVDAVLDAVADLVPAGAAAVARDLARYALERLDEVFQEETLVYEECSHLPSRARDIHLEACEGAPPDPVALAAFLFEGATGRDDGLFVRAPDLYGDVLGEAGLAEYHRLAEDALASLPPPEGGPGTFDGFTAARLQLVQMLDAVAAREGDIDRRIALLSLDLPTSDCYLHLCKVCLEHGREAEALRYAEDGLRVLARRGYDHRLVQFAADRHAAAGDDAAAVALLWKAFEWQPSLSLFRHLRRIGGEAARDEAIAALRQAVTKPSKAQRDWLEPGGLLIDVLMVEQMFAEAWQVARAHRIDAVRILRLAAASEASCPTEAAAAYVARIETLVPQGGNDNYAEATRLLGRLAGLRSAAAHAAHVSDLRQRFKAKRNFMKMIREA